MKNDTNFDDILVSLNIANTQQNTQPSCVLPVNNTVDLQSTMSNFQSFAGLPTINNYGNINIIPKWFFQLILYSWYISEKNLLSELLLKLLLLNYMIIVLLQIWQNTLNKSIYITFSYFMKINKLDRCFRDNNLWKSWIAFGLICSWDNLKLYIVHFYLQSYLLNIDFSTSSVQRFLLVFLSIVISGSNYVIKQSQSCVEVDMRLNGPRKQYRLRPIQPHIDFYTRLYVHKVEWKGCIEQEKSQRSVWKSSMKSKTWTHGPCFKT